MFKVMKKCCGECLFSKNKIVSESRKKSLLSDIKRNQGFFECHKATAENKVICCRGFYEQKGHESQMIRISQRLGAVEFIELDDLNEI